MYIICIHLTRLLFQLLVILTESFIKEVEKIFGSYEGGQRETVEEKPTFHMNQIARKKDTEQAHLCLGFEGLQVGHEDIYSSHHLK